MKTFIFFHIIASIQHLPLYLALLSSGFGTTTNSEADLCT